MVFGIILILISLPLMFVPILGVPLLIIGIVMIAKIVGAENSEKTAQAIVRAQHFKLSAE